MTDENCIEGGMMSEQLWTDEAIEQAVLDMSFDWIEEQKHAIGVITGMRDEYEAERANLLTRLDAVLQATAETSNMLNDRLLDRIDDLEKAKARIAELEAQRVTCPAKVRVTKLQVLNTGRVDVGEILHVMHWIQRPGEEARFWVYRHSYVEAIPVTDCEPVPDEESKP